MATNRYNAGIVNTKSIKQRFLNCNVCLREYDDNLRTPRLLPCLHTFCTECIENLLKQSLNRNIKCPICRCEHGVFYKKANTFPKDNTRRDLLEFIETMDSSGVLCKECTDNNYASYRCKNCAAFLCDPCYDAHRRTRFTRDHKILRLEELKNESELFKEFMNEGFCQVAGHENVQLKLYCAAPECSKPICYNCAASVHRDHTKHPVTDLLEVYQSKKDELYSLLTKIKSLKMEVGKTKEEIDREINKLNLEGKNTEKDLVDAFQDCIENLRKRKQQLIEMKNKIIQTKNKKLENQRKSLTKYIEELEEGCQFTEETLQFKDAAGLLEIEEIVRKRLHKLQDKKVSKVTKYFNTEFEFQKNKMLTDFESYCKEMGSIISTDAYPPNTKMIVSNPALAGKETTLTVQLFDSTNKLITNKELELEIRITQIGVCDETKRCSLQSENNYIIKFTPPTSGAYNVTVQALGGKLLLKSECIQIKVNVPAQIPLNLPSISKTIVTRNH